MTVPRPAKPRRYESPAGLVVHVNANGSIRRMEHGDIVLNLFPGTEMEGGPANLYLRRLGNQIAWTPLLGPRSPLALRLDAAGLRATRRVARAPHHPRAGARQGKPLVVLARQDGEPDGRRGRPSTSSTRRTLRSRTTARSA